MLFYNSRYKCIGYSFQDKTKYFTDDATWIFNQSLTDKLNITIILEYT